MILCKHKWNKIRLLKEYYDYTGFKVGIFECVCTKCGKISNKKFW